MKSESHPSFLVLDRIALGDATLSKEQEHVTACATCQTHVSRVQATRPVPAWARELAAKPRQNAMSRWVWGSAMGTALAAAAVFLALHTPNMNAEYTTVRGEPSLGLYIKRGERVSLWDGREAITPGDRLRLKVVPEGFTRVTVFSPTTDPQHPELLFASPIDPTKENLLPRAWAVDDTPGAEALIVVLSHAPVSPGRVSLADTRTTNLWIRHLSIPKRIK